MLSFLIIKCNNFIDNKLLLSTLKLIPSSKQFHAHYYITLINSMKCVQYSPVQKSSPVNSDSPMLVANYNGPQHTLPWND